MGGEKLNIIQRRFFEGLTSCLTLVFNSINHHHSNDVHDWNVGLQSTLCSVFQYFIISAKQIYDNCSKLFIHISHYLVIIRFSTSGERCV